MTPKEKDAAAHQQNTLPAANRAPGERLPWVAPSLDRLDLREAMSGPGGVLDATNFSS